MRAKGADSQSEVDSSESEARASGYQSGVFSCIVRHHHEAMTNEGMEDLGLH
jgi:hypothetical protein